jgi:hypothetical protein
MSLSLFLIIGVIAAIALVVCLIVLFSRGGK